ncbi:Uncharacterised protein [Veillonella ratti]|uniref:Uncharacterized protein n=1 Tax=Veillonella ratti TaxID=103892 RepID=A0A6N3BYN6_9FIRM
MGCDHHVKVNVVKSSNPVRVNVSKGSGGSTGDVDLSSVLGIIKKLETLPHLSKEDVQVLINKSLPDLSNLYARLATAEAFGREINDAVARMNMEFGDDIFYLKETVKYFLTEQQIKDIITNTVGDAVEQMRRNYNDLFDEIDMTNSTLNRIKMTMLTETQVQNLIDTALSKLVNAEEVRY